MRGGTGTNIRQFHRAGGCLSMSPLSKETIQDLQKILLEEYSLNLSLQQVTAIGAGWVGYFDTLAKVHHQSVVEDRDLPILKLVGKSGN